MSRKPLFNPQTRGTCPVCGRICFLRKSDMKVGRHGDPHAWPPRACPGWGQPAATTLVDPDARCIADTIRTFAWDTYNVQITDERLADDLATAISTALKQPRT